MPQEPYSVIFPDSNDPVFVLSLPRKLGGIPRGDYGFVELYCTDKGCDCRRVTILVLDKKMKTKAVICMGFDPDEPMAGPFLDGTRKQSACAGEILRLFVEMINDEPESLAMFHRHYREVRGKIDGKPYRGKPFPGPGTVERMATEPPPLDELFLDLVKTAAKSGPKPESALRSGSRRRPGKGKPEMVQFVERYRLSRKNEKFTDHAGHLELQHELRRCLLENERSGDELASLLVGYCESGDDERLDATLGMLFDALETLRIELERKRPASGERMERLQTSLAEQVFLKCGDAKLCAAVSHMLLQSRIGLLPVLHEANSRRLMEMASADEAGSRNENPLDGLMESIREISGSSPFEALDALLQVLALSPAEVQIALCGEMLNAEDPLSRDTAALMLLHPSPEVRSGVSSLLAARAESITPETLRRLIISRNWFPEDIRANIDATVSAARRSRIQCAPLPKSLEAKTYASPIDGAAAQSFQVIVPDGRSYRSCSILLKRGEGVADAFEIQLSSKRELKDFLMVMNNEGAFIESTSEYLDQRICHALAEGAALGKAPNYWLLQVAEVLGKDQWKAVSLDPLRELGAMRAELESNAPELLSDRSRKKALNDSEEWGIEHPFAHSWYEDDVDVDRIIDATCFGRGAARFSVEKAIGVLFSEILEKRRAAWLERFILSALWLKSSRRPPVPWHQMFHLATAVADSGIRLDRIPLMETVASHTLGAYLERREEAEDKR